MHGQYLKLRQGRFLDIPQFITVIETLLVILLVLVVAAAAVVVVVVIVPGYIPLALQFSPPLGLKRPPGTIS